MHLSLRITLASTVLITTLLPSCGGDRDAKPDHPLVVIGVDGLEWRVLMPLIREGKLPHLREMVERGASGYLFTFKPALSPAIWTSVATGKHPRQHKIVSFLDPATGHPFTSNARDGRALWNIASEYGLKTLCVGWWVTYPAEEIDGWMVAPYSAAGQNDQNWKGNLVPDLEGQTWPPELFESVFPLAERLADTEQFLEVDRPYFGDVDLDQLGAVERKLVGQTRWSIAADESFVDIACYLLEQDDVTPDLTMVYMGGPDVASHRFWRYRWPNEFRYEVSATATKQLREIIERFYIQVDRQVGEILARVPPESNVIICSDHGFHAEYTGQPHPTGMSAHHLDGPPGVVIMAGPDIRSVGAREILEPSAGTPPLRLGRVFEIAPVALHLLGIPLAERMQIADGGSLMRNALAEDLLARRPPVPRIDSHDDDFRSPTAPQGVSEELDTDFKAWLSELGYLNAVTEETEFHEVLPGSADDGEEIEGGSRR